MAEYAQHFNESVKPPNLVEMAGRAHVSQVERGEMITAEAHDASVTSGVQDTGDNGVGHKKKKDDDAYGRNYINAVAAESSLNIAFLYEQAKDVFDAGIQSYNDRYQVVLAENGTDEFGAILDPDGDAALAAAWEQNGAAVEQEFVDAGLGAEFKVLQDGPSAEGVDFQTYRAAAQAAQDAGLQPMLDDALYEYMLENDPNNPVMDTLAGDRMANRHNLRAVDALEEQKSAELAAASPDDTIAEGARATASADQYVQDPKLAAIKAAAPPVNNQFAAAVTPPANTPQLAPTVTPQQPATSYSTYTA